MVREKQLQVILDRLVAYISSKEEELRDIASLGLKTVMAEIPTDSSLAARAGNSLTPKLLSQISDVSTGKVRPIAATHTLNNHLPPLFPMAALDLTGSLD